MTEYNTSRRQYVRTVAGVGVGGMVGLGDNNVYAISGDKTSASASGTSDEAVISVTPSSLVLDKGSQAEIMIQATADSTAFEDITNIGVQYAPGGDSGTLWEYTLTDVKYIDDWQWITEPKSGQWNFSSIRKNSTSVPELNFNITVAENAESGEHSLRVFASKTEWVSRDPGAGWKTTVLDEQVIDITVVVGPTADIELDQDNLAPSQEVTLNATGSSVPNGTISSYKWTIDGTTYTGQTVQHTFDTPGTYTVGLTVTDDTGATATTSQNVTVSAPPTTTAPPTQALNEQQGANGETTTPADDGGGIPVLNRFGDSSTSLGMGVGLLGLLGGGGYLAYRRSNDDAEDKWSDQQDD